MKFANGISQTYTFEFWGKRWGKISAFFSKLF